jgi:eight-cysteine-cluster-containing protein
MSDSISSSGTSRDRAQLSFTVDRLLVVLAVVALAGCSVTNDNPRPREADSCHVTGCSAQVCSDLTDVVTTCEWRDVYECYASASCERQSDGACGWTPTEELNACVARHSP